MNNSVRRRNWMLSSQRQQRVQRISSGSLHLSNVQCTGFIFSLNSPWHSPILFQFSPVLCSAPCRKKMGSFQHNHQALLWNDKFMRPSNCTAQAMVHRTS